MMLKFVTLLIVMLILFPVQAEAAVHNSPINHAQVKGDSGQDGEVLATRIVTVKGVRSIVMGGNFDSLLLPNGKLVVAKNLAVVSLYDPNKIIYAGNVNDHVRALAVDGGRLYLGGSFTSVNNQPRKYIAALNLNDMSLQSFAARSDKAVYGMDAKKGRIVYGGGDALVRGVNSSGRVLWSKVKTTGAVRTVLIHPNGSTVYIGGLFDSFAGRKQHGLVRANSQTGKLYKFNPKFRFDNPLNKYDGDCILSLAWGNGRLLVGSGGGGGKLSKNALWSLNASTGSWKGSGWGTAYFRIAGDVQAVASHEGLVYAGHHRSHGKYFQNRGRFTAAFNLKNGKPSTWDPGLWGNQRNQSGNNNGVSSLTSGSGYLVVGGAFLGSGDRSKDPVGKAGVHRQGLAVFS